MHTDIQFAWASARNLPGWLRAHGIEGRVLSAVADGQDGCSLSNVRPISQEDYRDILVQAYSG